MSNALIALREELRDAGLVDTHYHVGPELIVRRYDVKTLADKAVPFGATLVLKNHTYPTTPLASLARGHFGANFLGGVVLNNYVGGLNPQAVQGAHSGNRSNVSDPTPDPMPIVVWIPTVHMPSHTCGCMASALTLAGPDAARMQPTLSPLFPHRSSLTPRSLYSMNPANPNPN